MKLKVKKNINILSYEAYYRTFCKWLKLKNEGKTLQKFFDDNYIKTIAVYGLGDFGKNVYEELAKLDIKILYGIDKNADKLYTDTLKIIKPNGKLDAVDAVIVTTLHFFADIEKMLYEKGIKNIISLEDVVGYCI